MRDLNKFYLTNAYGKSSKKPYNRGKSFGYQVLGFGSGVSAGRAPYDISFLVVGGGGAGAGVRDGVNSNAVEELLVTAESGAVTIAGTAADNDLCYFRVGRDVSDGNDDMAGDMRLHGIKIFFTTDAANDA